MKIGQILCLMTFFCVIGLLAMNEPLSLEQYKQVLNAGDCAEIVKATKQLWPDGRDGIHLHWNGRDFQIAGDQKLLSNGTYLKDVPYRDALRDWFVKQILHPAMYRTADIAQTFARIDELSNNCDGVFGIDKRAYTQTEIKCAIVAARFGHDREEHGRQAAHFKLPGIYNRHTTNDLINYVGIHSGELSFLGGKLPFKLKLYNSRRLIGFVAFAAVVCIGGYIAYKKYWAENEEDEADEEEQTSIQYQANGEYRGIA